MGFFLFQQTNILRFFITSIADENWREIAQAWIVTCLIVGAVGVVLFHIFKAFMKKASPNIHKMIWSRAETWRAMLLSIFPLFFVLTAVWFVNKSFQKFVQVPGLLKGALLMGAVFLIISFFVHLISPWRRELV